VVRPAEESHAQRNCWRKKMLRQLGTPQGGYRNGSQGCLIGGGRVRSSVARAEPACSCSWCKSAELRQYLFRRLVSKLVLL